MSVLFTQHALERMSEKGVTKKDVALLVEMIERVAAATAETASGHDWSFSKLHHDPFKKLHDWSFSKLPPDLLNKPQHDDSFSKPQRNFFELSKFKSEDDVVQARGEDGENVLLIRAGNMGAIMAVDPRKPEKIVVMTVYRLDEAERGEIRVNLKDHLAARAKDSASQP